MYIPKVIGEYIRSSEKVVVVSSDKYFFEQFPNVVNVMTMNEFINAIDYDYSGVDMIILDHVLLSTYREVRKIAKPTRIKTIIMVMTIAIGWMHVLQCSSAIHTPLCLDVNTICGDFVAVPDTIKQKVVVYQNDALDWMFSQEKLEKSIAREKEVEAALAKHAAIHGPFPKMSFSSLRRFNEM
jgi:hypothetical protein